MNPYKLMLCLFLAYASSFHESSQALDRVDIQHERCESLTSNTWTLSEQWAWNRLCRGKTADFSQLVRSTDQPTSRAEEHELHEISASFFEDILTRDPWSVSTSGRKIKIANVLVRQRVNLSHSLIKKTLDFENVQFQESVEMEGAFVDGSIVLNKCGFTELRMREAVIRGSFEASFTEFEVIDLNGASLGSSLQLQENRSNRSILLLSASQVNGSVQLKGGLPYSYINASGASVSGQFNISRTNMGIGLVADTLHVGHSMFLEHSKIPYFNGAFLSVDKNLDLRGSVFQYVNLTGASVSKELRFYSQGIDIRWLTPSHLVLRNASTTELQDSENSWPSCFREPRFEKRDGLLTRRNELSNYGGMRAIRSLDLAYAEWLLSTRDYCTDLVGFQYDLFGGMNLEGGVLDRESDWYFQWLDTSKGFSSHSYLHLASVLRSMGYSDKADKVLYREREVTRNSAFREKNYGKWIWYTLLKYGVGYGLGSRTLQIFYWFAGFLIVGWMFLFCSTRSASRSIDKLAWNGFWYSFDLLVPFVRLDDRHYAIEHSGITRSYFYIHQMAGYVILTLLVSVLGRLV